MIPTPIKSMIISGTIIFVTIIVISILFSIEEKRLKKEELIEELMIKLKIPKRDIEKIFKNNKKYKISKIELNENSIWNLYLKAILNSETINKYINNKMPEYIKTYNQLIDYLSNRSNKNHAAILRSYRRLLWLIEDTKIKYKERDLIQNKIKKDFKCVFTLFQTLKSKESKSIEIKVKKDIIYNLNLDNYSLFIDNILNQISLCNQV